MTLISSNDPLTRGCASRGKVQSSINDPARDKDPNPTLPHWEGDVDYTASGRDFWMVWPQ
jgi:hypothetical protein